MSLGFTFLVAAPDLQHAMIADDNPTTLTWTQLVRDGNGGAAFNTVTESGLETLDFAAYGIDLETVGTNGASETGVLDQISAHLGTFSNEVALQTRFQRLLSLPTTEYVKVLPRGYTPDRVPAAVVVPLRQQEIKTAVDEISNSESLTGYFSKYRPSPMVTKLAALTGSELPSATFGNQYVYEHAGAAPTRSTAVIQLAISSLLAVASLLICGSGAPSKLAGLFSPVQALISLLGYPLRCGRGSLITRTIYAVGAGWIGWQGYQVAFESGGLGRSDGYFFEVSVGICMILVSVAGLVGVCCSMRSNFSRKSGRFSKPEGAAPVAIIESTPKIVDRMSIVNGSRSRSRRYCELEIDVPHSFNLGSQTTEAYESLERLDFESPLVISFTSDSESGLVTLQLGCEKTVTAVIADRPEGATVDLTTVLADGFCVTSTMSDQEVQSELQDYPGLRVSGPSVPIFDLLSTHLETVCRIASERQTTVVICDSGETREIFQYKQRIYAELRRLTLDELIEVPEAVYGRFSFPCRPVAELEPITV